MARKYELTEDEARLAFTQVSGHIQALKNWIASAVEAGDMSRARTLVFELRKHDALFKKLNVAAHRFIDAAEHSEVRDGD